MDEMTTRVRRSLVIRLINIQEENTVKPKQPDRRCRTARGNDRPQTRNGRSCPEGETFRRELYNKNEMKGEKRREKDPQISVVFFHASMPRCPLQARKTLVSVAIISNRHV